MANLSNINNKFLVTTGGNVLIGQTTAVGTPIFQVTGTNHLVTFKNTNNTANTYAQMLLQAGDATNYIWTAAQNSTNWAGSRSLNIYTAQTGANIGFFTEGDASNTKLMILGDGDVGIGTNSPDAKLDILGQTLNLGGDNGSWNARTNSTVKTGFITSPHYTNAEEDIMGMIMIGLSNANEIDIGGGTSTYNAATDIKFFTASNSTTVTGTSRMRIESDGNIFMDSPKGSGENLNLVISDTTTGYAAGTGGSILFQGIFNSNNNLGGAAAIQASKTNSTNGDYSYNLDFYTRKLGTSIERQMTIDSSGNVGINVANPGFQSVDGYGQIGIEIKGGKENNQAPCLRLHETGSGKGSFELRSTRNILTSGNYFAIAEGTDTLFAIRGDNDSGGVTQRGNVGIGTTSPNARLEVTSGQAKTVTSGVEFARFGTSNEASNYATLTCEVKGAAAAADRQWIFQTVESGVANAGNIAFQPSGGNVGIGVTDPDAKLQVNGSISSGTATAPTQIIYDSNGNVRSFTHNFTEEKSTPSARNVTFVDVSGVGNFHQAFFYVQYGTRLQSVSDATTGVVIRTYGVNRFNGGTLQVTETNAIAGSSNSLTHALVSVAIVSNTQYRVIVEFSSTLGASSFVSGEIKGYGVGDTFPTITFAEGAAG